MREIAAAGYSIHFKFDDVAEISEKYPGMRFLEAGAVAPSEFLLFTVAKSSQSIRWFLNSSTLALHETSS